jgi:hypothetical protein
VKSLILTDVQFTAGTKQEVAAGLVGYLAATLNGALRLDGITLRRTADGRSAISFPGRRDGQGRQRFYIRPLSDPARLELEHQIFEALGIKEGF